ncbi:MAG: hypothetical protein ABIQ44_08875, partial [Chloroflexia bacterium]
MSLSVAMILALLVAPLTLKGQTAPLVTVSSASYKPTVAPGSIATVFGQNLATRVEAARLDDAGKLPVTLAGTSVTVGGKAAELIYVSPTQVNFVVPEALSAGELEILVKSSALAADLKAKVSVARIAPGIFSIPCLRIDRAAVLNAVTYALEPFQSVTEANGGRDLRTRLSIFGTGIRFAGGGVSTNVGEFVKVEATDSRGVKTLLVVEYAGAAPNFFGLDQINVVLPAELERVGLLKLRLLVDGLESNVVTMVVETGHTEAGGTVDGGYRISTVVGSGATGSVQDGMRALEFRLNTPNAIAFGVDGTMYIADSGDHTVMRVGTDGLIYKFAGNGTDGSGGDEGLAKDASLRSPVSLAMDRSGSLYIVDGGDHRVRVVTKDGRIHAFAGSGVSGFSGDGGPATAARIANPTAVVVDRYGTAYISDTNNNRVRRVTGDGRIST